VVHDRLSYTSSVKPYKFFELANGLGKGSGEKQANLHARTLRGLQAGNMYSESIWEAMEPMYKTLMVQLGNTRYPFKEDGAHVWAEHDVLPHPFWCHSFKCA